MGARASLRRYALSLMDGVWPVGFSRRFRFKKGRGVNLGLKLLQYTTPHLPIVEPWAWRLLLNVNVRSYRSSRYKMSLPSSGQRTRSNHQTAKKLRDPAVTHLAGALGVYLNGFLKARSGISVTKNRPGKKSKPGALKLKGKAPAGKAKGVIRSKKKLDVWR